MRNLLLVLKAVNAKSVGRRAFGTLIEIYFRTGCPSVSNPVAAPTVTTVELVVTTLCLCQSSY